MSSVNELSKMWKIWTLVDPKLALPGLFAFLAVLAFLIHFLLLASPGFNWLSTGPSPAAHFLPPAVK